MARRNIETNRADLKDCLDTAKADPERLFSLGSLQGLAVHRGFRDAYQYVLRQIGSRYADIYFEIVGPDREEIDALHREERSRRCKERRKRYRVRRRYRREVARRQEQERIEIEEERRREEAAEARDDKPGDPPTEPRRPRPKIPPKAPDTVGELIEEDSGIRS